MSGDLSNSDGSHVPVVNSADPVQSASPQELPPMNGWFNLCGGLTAMFIITIFAFVASMLGDPESPATQFLDRYGGTVMGFEVTAIVVTGLLAMGNDGPEKQAKHKRPAESSEPASSG